MSTYQLPLKFFLPLLSVHMVPNRDIGLYGHFNTGCDAKKKR
jgi:hypothetical protein